jgi:enhancing lycopene biosynthesis protein 2
MPETRNVLVESARIARGMVKPIAELSIDDIDALVIPGGFGAAKNLNRWAFEGPDGAIDPEVQRLIGQMVMANKPVCGLCMGPTVIAKALENTGIHAELTVGTTAEPSPYDIAAISGGMQRLGAQPEMRTVRQLAVDARHKIVTAPCYMMEASISEVYANVKAAVDETLRLAKG